MLPNSNILPTLLWPIENVSIVLSRWAIFDEIIIAVGINWWSFWTLQKEEIHQNVSAGVILTDTSLVLQKVTKYAAGNYTCMASNSEGKGVSNPVTLAIMCKWISFCYFLEMNSVWRAIHRSGDEKGYFERCCEIWKWIEKNDSSRYEALVGSWTTDSMIQVILTSCKPPLPPPLS